MMAEVEGDKTSKKLLDNLLKSHALKEVMNKGHASTASSSSSSMPSTSSQSQDSTEKRDLFQLPPLPEEFIRYMFFRHVYCHLKLKTTVFINAFSAPIKADLNAKPHCIARSTGT